MKSLLKLLRYLVETGGTLEARDKVLDQLRAQGWAEHPSLPGGWMRMRGEDGLGFHYLRFSPAVKKYKSQGAALGALRKQGLGRSWLARFVLAESGIEHSWEEGEGVGWREAGESLPQGWRSRRSEGGSDLISKDGIVFKDRTTAMMHLLQELSRDVYSRHEVTDMASCLVHEGWTDHTMIPDGWKIRRTKSVSDFLTRDGTLLPNYSEAMKYVCDPKNKNKMSPQEQRNFKESWESLARNATPQTLPEILMPPEEKEGVLPTGWTREKLDEKLIKITAPDGSVFFSRIKAMEHMIEEGVGQEHILSLWRELDQEGWVFAVPHLPQGWGVRGEGGLSYLFLTRELEVLVSSEQALAYIENEDNYTGEDYKRMDRWVDQLKGGDWEEDADLPIGWKQREDEEEDTLYLEGSTGTVLTGRVALIRQLLQQGEEGGVVLGLWQTLDMEGWMTDPALPPGWKSKYDLDSNQFQQLSPLMDVVSSPKNLEVGERPSEDYRVLLDHLNTWNTRGQA